MWRHKYKGEGAGASRSPRQILAFILAFAFVIELIPLKANAAWGNYGDPKFCITSNIDLLSSGSSDSITLAGAFSNMNPELHVEKTEINGEPKFQYTWESLTTRTYNFAALLSNYGVSSEECLHPLKKIIFGGTKQVSKDDSTIVPLDNYQVTIPDNTWETIEVPDFPGSLSNKGPISIVWDKSSSNGTIRIIYPGGACSSFLQTITVDLIFEENEALDREKFQLEVADTSVQFCTVESNLGTNTILDDGHPATRYTVIASASAGYEYGGYTLTTASGAKEEVDWDIVNYTYDTKESNSGDERDTRRSTATFDVTITENTTLDFHFKEMDKAGLFAPENTATTFYKGAGTDEESASLTSGYPVTTGTVVNSYKAGDNAYINIQSKPLHGTISYEASEQPLSITVYEGNGTDGEILLKKSHRFATGGWHYENGKPSYEYSANVHPFNDPRTGALGVLNLDLRLQLPASDYITVVVDWPYFEKTWKLPIKVMDTNNPYIAELRTEYDKYAKATGYSPFRYYLDLAFEEESTKILNAETQEEQEELLRAALERVKNASEGVGADAVVWRFHSRSGGDDSLPILVAVPADTTNGHTSMIAALDAAFPKNWTYEYSLGGFGSAVNNIEWGKPENTGNTIVHITTTFEYGNYGSFFNDRDGYSQVGVSGYPAVDGSIMAWNINADLSQWNYALLRWYFGDEGIDAALAQKGTTLSAAIQLSTDELNALFPTEDLDHNDIPGDDFRRYGLFKEETAANEVIRLILAIGDVNPRSGEAIQAARAAYEALSAEEKAKVTNYQDLVDAEETYRKLMDSSSSSAEWQSALLATVSSFQLSDPIVGSTNGEWAVLAAARYLNLKTGTEVAEDEDTPYADKYLTALGRELRTKGLNGLDPTGNQHTEYSRIVLALSALGIDASDFVDSADKTHYNFISKLEETSMVISQGINGPIFALLALDSMPYESNTRQTYIDKIVNSALTYGGWSYDGSTADTDMTAMAIQALAPYYTSDLAVQKAVNLALDVLASKQSPEGGFYSGGTYNSESCSQVIVALTTLAYYTGGEALSGNTWSVCGTEFKNPVNALMSFYKDGMFGHALSDTDQMATEQAAYALVAYSRYSNGQYPLYTMRDAFETEGDTTSTDLRDVLAALGKVTDKFNDEEELKWLTAEMPEDQIKAKVESTLSGLELPPVTYAVAVNEVTAPINGTSAAPNGTDGKAAFTVTLTKGSVTRTVAISKALPAEKYLSDENSLRAVAVMGKAGKILEDGTIIVTLEKEMAEQGIRLTNDDFEIIPKDPGATCSTPTQQTPNTWTFQIKSASGQWSPDYTIQLEYSDYAQEIAQASLDAAASAVSSANNEALPMDTWTKAMVKTWVNGLIPASAGLERVTEILEYIPATDGIKDNPDGTDGCATIKVTLATTYKAGAESSTGLDEDEYDSAALLEEANAKLAAAKETAEQALSDFSDLPDTTDPFEFASWAAEKLSAVWNSDVQYTLAVEVVPAEDGTEEAPEGIPGKITFTVELSCAAGEETLTDSVVVEQTLNATPYEKPEQEPEPVDTPDPAPAPEPDPEQDEDESIESSDTGDTVVDDDPTDASDDTAAPDSAAPAAGPDTAFVSAARFLYNDAPETRIETSVTITVKIPAKTYVPSNETGLTSVVYNNQALASSDGYNYTLELPTGETFNTAWLTITTKDPDATFSKLTSEENGLWKFTVTAANGTDTANYSILVTTVSGTKEENQAAVNNAYAKINALDSWTVPMDTVKNIASGVKTYINTSIAGLIGNVSCSIDISDFTPAKEGVKENPKGTDGSYTATITLSKGIPGSSTYVEESLTVKGVITAKEYEAKPEGEITVYFTLLGDDAHGDPGTSNTHTLAGRNLDIWIPEQTVTVPAGSVVGDVFAQVLDEWGYRYIGLESNYIKTIITPRGLSLSEFTNGKLSGWMYTVNGEHPNQGLQKWTVYDGDEIVWHYTDDYTQERGGTGSSNTSSNTELTPTATVRNGSASAAIDSDELLGAVEAAVQNRINNILIAPLGAERADTLSVDLPVDALYEAGRNGVGVTIESGAGIVTIPSSVLSSIARSATGYDVTITTAAQSAYQAEKLLEGEELTEEQLANCSVTEVTITSGRSNITSWSGGSLTLSLPVDSRNFEARERYTVYQISDDGSIEELTGRCVKSGSSLYVEVDVTHLSTFVVVPNADEALKIEEDDASTANMINGGPSIVPFMDVTNHWALDSIGFVYQRGLMAGTGANTFEPNIDMSRAMFVTVLHRLEGTPAFTGTVAYTDVKADSWYTNAVAWATDAGIVNGTGAGKFSPDASITREEMATMMMRYAKYKGYDTAATTDLSSYADVSQINDWAYRAMEWAGGTGMITGRTAFTLVPRGTATRAETATILMRFIQTFVPTT